MDIAEKIRLLTIPPGAMIRQAMQAIEAGALGVALVIESESGRFVGLLTDGDLRRGLLLGLGLESPVATILRQNSITVRVNTPHEEVVSLFSEAIRVIPVLNEHDQIVDLALFDSRAHLPIAQPLLGERELVYVTECILSGWISSTGRFVKEFEKRCADYCRVPHAISTSNGTTALHLALLALDIGPGDEVIVPTLTFIASANSVVYTGARPVFVDSEPVSWNMDPAAVERAITPRTKAVMAVHLYGHPADMRALREICNRHSLYLVEDAAEAFGSTYYGEPAGSLSDIATFSFFGNKIITTGEGGMVLTANRVYAEKCRILRDHGMSPTRRYWHPVLGYNYRMTNLQAAVGVAQIEKIESIISAKRKIAAEYQSALASIPGLTLQQEPIGTVSVFWLNSLCIDAGVFGVDRDSVMSDLKTQGIETRPLFPVTHLQPYYASGPHAPMPIAEGLSARGLSLPSDPTLTKAEISRIAACIRQAAKSGGMASVNEPQL